MTMPSALIRLQTPNDHAALIEMNERAFGPGRFARTAYRVREGAMRDPRLNLCAVLEGKIIGSVDFTPIAVGAVPGALLLGPLLIAEDYKNQGHGLRLMLDGLERARELDYKLVILVGDLPYYSRARFEPTPPGHIAFPGPVDPARILHVDLIADALKAYRGLVRGIPCRTPLL